ncbi:MAG: biotin carboxylase N-terminal domain-containing protein [Nitriliruptoraceae bacterium]
MFERVLVANRGVAAVRVAQTLRRLGVSWVAVYSEADADHAYVREADEAVRLGPGPARESYLSRDAVIAALHATGCDAVHPGYGFLAEDPLFAAAVIDAGATFIGPSPAHIQTMGDKVAARKVMAAAGVPVLPASGAIPDDVEDWSQWLDPIGFPVLVKASAGGGGIGMQRVESAKDLTRAVERTRQMAARAFGDDTVYLERCLDRARHVELQLIGDRDGHVRYLGARDCSSQRRHQKIIEEAPAPALDSNVHEHVVSAVVAALSAMGYQGLGTVEMLLDDTGRYAFLEMNTRLQVEHGVTEAVTGLDLVELQVRVAAGDDIDELISEPVAPRGHAIEVRIYAEDSVRFFPSPGTLTVFDLPQRAGTTVTTHVSTGTQISSNYDPMLALMVVTGDDRADAIDQTLTALEAVVIEGVATNVKFLQRLIDDQSFRKVEHHTTFAEALARTPSHDPSPDT